MNCATHSNATAVAYCRTCGKPLCGSCTRDVRGVIYCENCLAERLQGVQPQPTPYQQVMEQGLGIKVPPGPAQGPNPTVAGILAGFFPVGVGAVYNGQYAKGLTHLGILVLMIIALNAGLPWYVDMTLGILLGFFYFYQIIDAVRSAKAIQMGTPPPDPFGLSQTFGTGQAIDAAKVPTGALVLIGIGVIFLLHTMGIGFFSLDRFWPVILIVIGGWLFARRFGVIGPETGACRCERCRSQGLMGPAVLVTLGIQFLLDRLDVVSFGKTLPALLIVIGLVMVFKSNASTSGHVGGPPASGDSGPTGVATGEVQTPPSEVKHG